MYVGLVGLIYGTGCILGPIIGGAFSDSSATWRWVRVIPCSFLWPGMLTAMTVILSQLGYLWSHVTHLCIPPALLATTSGRRPQLLQEACGA